MQQVADHSWSHPANEGSRRQGIGSAFGWALGIEVVLVALAVMGLGRAVMPVRPADPVVLALAEEPQPEEPPAKPEPKPEPKPLPTPAVVQPQVKQQKQPTSTPTAPAPVVTSDAPLPVAAAPSPVSEPAPAVAPPTPHAGSEKPDPLLAYGPKVQAAVHAAYFYPPAAESLRFKGRVRLEFHLKDKVPSSVRVIASSGIGMIDRAAIQAVMSAQYTDPPYELAGVDHVFLVWVDYVPPG